MPALADTLRKDSPVGFVPTIPPLVTQPVTIPGQTNSFKVNPWIRSPLPPINAGPDTLRQFNDGDANIPRRRVLPLPTNNGLGGGSTVTNTTIVQAPSSGGTSSTALTAKTVTYVSPFLNTGSTSFSTLNLTAKSFQLISMTATGPCEVRIYGSAIAMAIDASRTMDAPPAAEYANNIITDIVLDTAPYIWNWQNRVGANSNTPQTSTAYIAVTNLSGGPTAVQINLTLLPLESQ
jgi:hypothetical protein